MLRDGAADETERGGGGGGAVWNVLVMQHSQVHKYIGDRYIHYTHNIDKAR